MGIQQIPLASAGLVVNDLVAATKWEKIAEYKNSSAVSSHTFSNIPQTYRTLRLDIVGVRSSSGEIGLGIRPNSDGNSNYAQVNNAQMYNSHDPQITVASAQWNLTLGWGIGTGYSHFTIEMPGYTSNESKFMTSYGMTNLGNRFHSTIGWYRSGSTTSPITSLQIRGDANFYYEGGWNPSYATLYGGI